MSEATPTVPDSDESAVVSTEDALAGLDDGAFVELVTAFWERQGWTVETVQDPESWYVDCSLHDGWPVEKHALGRIKRPSSRKQVSATDVQHFVRNVQKQEVDEGILVVPTAAPQSARKRAATFNVDVVGVEELARRVDEWDAHDVLAEHVDVAVTTGNRPPVVRALESVAPLLERFGVIEPIGRILERHLSTNPTVDDVAELSFTGFRAAFALTIAAFLSVFLVESGSLLYLLLMGAFLFVTYAILLPLMAVDLYVVRQFEVTEWRPSWLSLASFVFVPALFVVGPVYWYRRRRRTPSGQRTAW